MNKLSELQNRDLKKLEQKFDIGNSKLLSDRITHLKHMKVLRKTDGFAPWMCHWVYWDCKAGVYVGAAPDEEVLVRQADPVKFLQMFKAAVYEWQKEQTMSQNFKGF